MNWDSPSAFLAMGGHGLFVWGSYGVALLCMVIEPLLAVRRRQRAQAEAVNNARGSGKSGTDEASQEE
jgi:heme exporter protein D